ncbi:MAG TPA: hypothetical protein VGQ80_10620, partial [Acidimicrobiia bacterium]|nr:hypothetical protein [Acidimicrobiia bacterium]
MTGVMPPSLTASQIEAVRQLTAWKTPESETTTAVAAVPFVTKTTTGCREPFRPPARQVELVPQSM